MISSVYSYYLAQYGHKTNSKYDTHTKAQLKNTYGRVLKSNSQTPTYKTDMSEAAQKYAILFMTLIYRKNPRDMQLTLKRTQGHCLMLRKI